MKSTIKKGDTVKVISGNDRGKTGKVVHVLLEEGKILVEKVNTVKKHVKPSNTNPTGGIVEKNLPIAISNVMLVCKKCSNTVRVGIKFLEDRTKVRYCKKCGEVIE
ncbi:MAG: 50S ribosomal protein L24 [Deltaproteobacteria bacterium]|nr:50S ribosomal protein L24 [Deltaproteobacteria bacterium]MCL5791683.1 50S ribosomal protein L24 [Deltaproteobacteria bacterium]